MRYKKSILPNELNSVYHPKQEFSITLPRKKLDLNTFTLHYTGNSAVKSHIITFTTQYRVDFPTTITPATAGGPAAVLAVNLTNSSITINNHEIGPANTIIDVYYYTNGGNAIDPLVNGQRYRLQVIDDDTVEVLGPTLTVVNDNTQITLLSQGTGNHTFLAVNREWKTIPRFFPRLSSCILSDVSVSIDGKTAQHIKEYNTLAGILNDIKKEYDDVDGSISDSVKYSELSNTTGYINFGSKILPYVRDENFVDKYSILNKEQYFVNKWLGFLGENSSKYFDATDKDVKITFKLASPNILYKSVNANHVGGVQLHQYTYTDTRTYSFEPDYEIYDIKATIDVLDDIPIMNEFAFKDYAVQEGSYLATNKKCMLSLEIDKPVEWLLSTFKQPNYLNQDEGLQLMHCNDNINKFGPKMTYALTIEDINIRRPLDVVYSYEFAKIQKYPYVLNSSLWFSHQGDGIRYCKYRWNGYDLTPQMDMTMCYNETKKCFNTDFKKVPSILSFEADFFANAVRVDDNSYEYKKIDWEVEIDETKPNTKGGYPMMFCCFLNKL